MKQRMKYAALAFTLGLMALIFYFSGQPAADSYKLSETVTETVQTDGISFLLPRTSTRTCASGRMWRFLPRLV